MSAPLILLEPTIIQENIESAGNKLLIPYVDEIHLLANEYNAVLVPTHQALKDLL